MVGYFKKAMSFVEFWRKCLIVKWCLFASTEAEPPLQDHRDLSACVWPVQRRAKKVVLDPLAGTWGMKRNFGVGERVRQFLVKSYRVTVLFKNLEDFC